MGSSAGRFFYSSHFSNTSSPRITMRLMRGRRLIFVHVMLASVLCSSSLAMPLAYHAKVSNHHHCSDTYIHVHRQIDKACFGFAARYGSKALMSKRILRSSESPTVVTLFLHLMNLESLISGSMCHHAFFHVYKYSRMPPTHYTYMHTNTNTHTHTHTHTRAQFRLVCTCAFMHVNMHAIKLTSPSIAKTRPHTYMHAHIHIHAYTHAYTRTYTILEWEN